MSRFRVERIVIFTSLFLTCGACAESAGGGTYEDCIIKQTKLACDESEEACTRFLSEAGQRQARKLCLQTERPAAPQPAALTESAPQHPVEPQAAASTESAPQRPVEPQAAALTEGAPLRPVDPQPAASTESAPQPPRKRSRSQPRRAPLAERQPEDPRSHANKKHRQRRGNRPWVDRLLENCERPGRCGD
jgi:hypothetical protein